MTCSDPATVAETVGAAGTINGAAQMAVVMVLAVADESPVTQMLARRHHVSAAVVIVSLPRQVPQHRKVRQLLAPCQRLKPNARAHLCASA